MLRSATAICLCCQGPPGKSFPRLLSGLLEVEAHQALPFFRETLLFLVLTGILIPLLQRWRVNQVLGFLAAGALVGPFGLGLWAGEMPWLANFTFPRSE